MKIRQPSRTKTEADPVAVLISDIHFSVPTLKLAELALSQAAQKANQLGIPLVIAGDMHDTKANMRAECVNSLLELFQLTVPNETYILVGNHDLVNERSNEHALNFLSAYATIIDKPQDIPGVGHAIPYYSDPEALQTYLNILPKGSRLVMHQGVSGSNSGEYIQDKSALPKSSFKDFRVISGHYHSRQDIVCGEVRDNEVGLFSYIGNPYTLNFGEANDPTKGYQILMGDGRLEAVPTNLRKHVIYKADELAPRLGFPRIGGGDLLWIKVRGTKEYLASVTKEKLTKQYDIKQAFRLDLIPTDTKTQAPKELRQEDALDEIIDSISNTSAEQKQRLKTKWKSLV